MVRGMLGERLVRRNFFRCNIGWLSDCLVFNDALVKTKSTNGTDIGNCREVAVGAEAFVGMRAAIVVILPEVVAVTDEVEDEGDED